MSSSKETYRKFCELNKEIPLFLTYQWYDALFGEKWDVVLSTKGGEVRGFLPYQLNKRKTFNLISPPTLTPYQGAWLNYPKTQKKSSRLSFEKEVLSELIKKLPKTDLFQQKFYPSFANWLPFYWAGFSQTTRYTYIINNTVEEEIFANFKENIRREIRKAEKSLVVKSFDNIHYLYELKEQAYKVKSENYPIDKRTLMKAYEHCKEHELGELLAAVDEDGNIHSVLFYVWDANQTYYLHGATDIQFKTSGSMSLLLWEAIKRSAKESRSFNFEGSMVESIERYFRAFGGELTPYYEISKTNSKLLKLLKH